MVDRKARDTLAEQLRHLVSGLITNDQFNAALPVKTQDTGFWALEEQAWFLYSDLSQHKLTGSHALSTSDRRTISRFILFLHSDLEYEWSKHPCTGLVRLLLSILSFGQFPKHFDNKWKAQGDYDVYPFFRNGDYEKANANPKLLAGGKRV
jgi:hypothetical protein